jgi:hypothetical protein
MKRETLEVEGDNFGLNYVFRVRLSFWDRFWILIGWPCKKSGINQISAAAFPVPENETVFIRLEIRFNDLETL